MSMPTTTRVEMYRFHFHGFLSFSLNKLTYLGPNYALSGREVSKAHSLAQVLWVMTFHICLGSLCNYEWACSSLCNHLSQALWRISACISKYFLHMQSLEGVKMMQNRGRPWCKKMGPNSSSLEGLAAADREEIRDMFSRLDSDAAGTLTHIPVSAKQEK